MKIGTDLVQPLSLTPHDTLLYSLLCSSLDKLVRIKGLGKIMCGLCVVANASKIKDFIPYVGWSNL